MKPTERRAAGLQNRSKRPENPGNRAILAELSPLGHGNRAPDRRQTAFCAAKIAQQRAEPRPVAYNFFALFCGFCQKSPKNRRTRSRNLERIFSKKSRIGGKPPVLPKKNLDRVARSAPAAERNPPHRSPGTRHPAPGTRPVIRITRRNRQGPRHIGSYRRSGSGDRRATRHRPRCCQTGARAMFLSNNYVKNGMNVSRETLPNN